MRHVLSTSFIFAALAACDIPTGPEPTTSTTGEACVMTTGGTGDCPPGPDPVLPEMTTMYVGPEPANPCMSPGLPCYVDVENHCGDGVTCFACSDCTAGFCKVACSPAAPCANGTCSSEGSCLDEQGQFAPPAGCS